MARPKKLRVTHSMLWLDIAILKAEELLPPGLYYERAWSIMGRTCSKIGIVTQCDGLLLKYSYNGRALSYKVYFAYTNCNYGGRRKWFVCPQCGKIVRVIYGGEYFLCRSCQGLNYVSQKNRRGLISSQTEQLIKIRKNLGSDERATGYPTRLLCMEKPKGMHWGTYERLLDKAEQVELNIWDMRTGLEKRWDNCLSRIANNLIGEEAFRRCCENDLVLKNYNK